ncbi:BNR-4 repeat-containing protein [Shewanella mesophila]|uniref:BNR-4 repeat-containing protein n=1 Tax=Shewanella mesophila TaxID=2864208 RepID=UPI001C6567C2|nr:BNR-4 repeat-containing protein [Shewanella mesophila]QYJ85011.1 BNR-4 repeat-containing protein [Shewanella mesophila]
MLLRKILGCSLFISLTMSLAQADVKIEEVAYVDSSNQAGWWVPLSLKGDDAYFAFNSIGTSNGNHKVKIAKRDQNGDYTEGYIKNADGSHWVHNDDIGHDQPTVAVDGDGYVHVFADHHSDTDGFRYFRSESPESVAKIKRNTDIGFSSGQYTYPVATTAPDGDVYVIVRDVSGEDIGKGLLFRWDTNTQIWSLLTTFASQTNTRVYPDDVAVDENGDVHIIWEWSYDHPRADRHYGSYVKYEPDTGKTRTADGTEVASPVTLSTQGIFYQGLESGESFTSNNVGKGLQSAKLALGEGNRPSVVYRYRTNNTSNGSRDYEVFHIRWNGDSWVDRTSLFSTQDTIAALGHTLVGNRVRTYYVSDDKQIRVAEKNGDGSWSHYSIAPNKHIERIRVQTKNTGLDVVYATAPTEVSFTEGKLYALFAGDDLSTDIPLPASPNPVNASVSNGNDITITWSSVSNADYYEREYRSATSNWAWTYRKTYTAPQTSVTYTNQPARTSEYRVRACNDTGCSPWNTSNRINVSVPIPISPNPVNASVSNGNDITITWSSVSNADYYEREYRSATSNWAWTYRKTYTAPQTSVTYTNQPARTSEYRVRACNDTGCSPWNTSNRINVSVPIPIS